LNPLRAALFDFGDTLFYSPSGAEVLVEAGLEPLAAAALWDEIWRASKTSQELAKGRDLTPATHRDAWMALFSRAEEHVPGIAEVLYERVMIPTNWTPYPDAHPVLSVLHERDVKIGIVSNIAWRLEPVLDRHGLAAFVDAYVHSYEHGWEKPAPQLFAAACAELGVATTETIMVGDSYLADGGAVEAGLVTVLLPAVAPGAERGLARLLQLFPRS
jgi:putative hydrolase of the HAD superfamily